MLASKFLKKEPKQNFVVIKFDKFFKLLSNFYQSIIYWLNKKKIVISFIIFIASMIFNFTKKELLPMEDRGVYLVLGFH